MKTSNRLAMTLAILATVTAASAFGQVRPSRDDANEGRSVLQFTYRSARYFGEDHDYDSSLRLPLPPAAPVSDGFPGLPASWFELPLDGDAKRASADPLFRRSPELTNLLSRGSEPVHSHVPLSGRVSEQLKGHGSQDGGEFLFEGQDPFVPAPLPDSQQDSESSLIDQLITVRYQNPAMVRAIRAINSSQAIQLFSEVSQRIDERSLQPTSYDVRVRRAVRNLAIALDNEAFVDGLGLSADSFQLDGFRNSLGRLTDSGQVRNYAEALTMLNTIMRQAQVLEGLTPGVVGFEFTNAGIETLDKFSGLEPADPALRIGAGNDEHTSDVMDEEIVGIGLEVREHSEGLIVVKPVRGGPAAEADIERGDIIRSIDGIDIRGMKIVSSMDLLKGPGGSEMKLRIDRKGSTTRELVLTRRIVRVWAVNDAQLLSGTEVGYFSLGRFSQNAPAEVDLALNSLHDKGMKSLIIDLRGNPGGLLTTCVEISDRFVPCGIIVSTKGRLSSDDMIQEATYARTWSIPVVVLVDGDSASASEILAAAIQENKRGMVVGSHSYGKGTVQTHFPLSSIPGSLRLTTAMFYSPSGRMMAGKGITPDVGVDDPDGAQNGDKVLDEAIRIARSQALRDMAIASGICRPRNSSASRSSSLKDIMDPSHPGMIVL